jgi:hypothetical protein
MTARYRIQQGLRALFAFLRPIDRDLAEQVLTPDLLACFDSMRRGEQQHSLNVLRQLLAEGSIPDDLGVAALLHDVGKSRYPFPVWEKTLVVLVRAFAPRLFDRLSSGQETNRLCRPFILSVHHPTWSAEIVRAAGASARAVWLIDHHADDAAQWNRHPHVQLLERLQAADDAN